MFIAILLKGCHILKTPSIDSKPFKAAISGRVFRLDDLVNLVKNLSFHEANATTDVDRQTEGESGIHQWRVVFRLEDLVSLVKNMSLHEVNAATDIDQQTKGEPSIHEWKAISLS